MEEERLERGHIRVVIDLQTSLTLRSESNEEEPTERNKLKFFFGSEIERDGEEGKTTKNKFFPTSSSHYTQKRLNFWSFLPKRDGRRRK